MVEWIPNSFYMDFQRLKFQTKYQQWFFILTIGCLGAGGGNTDVIFCKCL